MAVEAPYAAIGTTAVWFGLFVAYYVNERRSDREDEGFAALVLSAVTIAVAVLLVAAAMLVGLAVQTYAPIISP